MPDEAAVFESAQRRCVGKEEVSTDKFDANNKTLLNSFLKYLAQNQWILFDLFGASIHGFSGQNFKSGHRLMLCRSTRVRLALCMLVVEGKEAGCRSYQRLRG